jgi:LDH2 family malate/lactate/ureidoglycolate dehydrogenase
MSSQDKDPATTRRQQVADSVRRHRKTRDRLEVYIPLGWRDRLRGVNEAKGVSTSEWVRQIVAARIGEYIES